MGAESALYSWKLTGELQTRASTSSATTYALALRPSNGGGGPHTVAVGGSAETVDVFIDPSHRAYALAVPA